MLLIHRILHTAINGLSEEELKKYGYDSLSSMMDGMRVRNKFINENSNITVLECSSYKA